jgi:hypothetical protein
MIFALCWFDEYVGLPEKVVTGDRALALAVHCCPVGRSGKAGITIALLDVTVTKF